MIADSYGRHLIPQARYLARVARLASRDPLLEMTPLEHALFGALVALVSLPSFVDRASNQQVALA